MILQADATVLIVDDDAANRTVLRLGCESVGIEVVEAATGMCALEKSGTTSFALILLDLGLPDISGLQVCRRLRAHDVVTPIIIVSAYSESARVEIGLAAGADDYIGKPYRVARLLARVLAYAQPRCTRVQLPGLPIERSTGLVTTDGSLTRGDVPASHPPLRVLQGGHPAQPRQALSSPPPWAHAPDARP